MPPLLCWCENLQAGVCENIVMEDVTVQKVLFWKGRVGFMRGRFITNSNQLMWMDGNEDIVLWSKEHSVRYGISLLVSITRKRHSIQMLAGEAWVELRIKRTKDAIRSGQMSCTKDFSQRSVGCRVKAGIGFCVGCYELWIGFMWALLSSPKTFSPLQNLNLCFFSLLFKSWNNRRGRWLKETFSV